MSTPTAAAKRWLYAVSLFDRQYNKLCAQTDSLKKRKMESIRHMYCFSGLYSTDTCIVLLSVL